MITLDHNSPIQIEKELRKIEVETASDGIFVSFSRSIATFLIRKILNKKLTRIKIHLLDVVDMISNNKTFVCNAKIHKFSIDILKDLKEIKGNNEVVFYYNSKLEELYNANIKLAYKVEKLVRTNLYSNNNLDKPSDLTIAVSQLSNKNLSQILYDPKST
jgi:hypothetical protein